MNALLDHRWGISSAQDRVWAQVTGLAPNRAVGRLIMVLQAFFDESFSDEEFILGGHIATAESWAVLSKEWEQLLPVFGTLNSEGKYHFKMSEMAQSSERMERVQVFYKLIEDNVITSISARLNLTDFRRAQDRATAFVSRMNWNVNFGMWTNPYFFAFRILLDGFHTQRNNFTSVPAGEKVDFIFDDRVEKTAILQAWNEYLEGRDEEVRGRYGATPRFENDQDFLPLQAADLWAWWVREWYEEDASLTPDKMRDLDFGKWRGKKRLKIVLGATEDQVVEALQAVPIELIAKGEYLLTGSFGVIKPDDI